MDVLICDCITSGVKLAGRQHGLLYGTREVVITVMSVTTIAGRRMRSDNGGGLSRSSDEFAERQWSEGLSLFGFSSDDNQKWEDLSIRNGITAKAIWYIHMWKYICD
ncbi:MAG TPA: hypothetical protein VFW11_22680 [Cyclobacteriaceae bacterium]|nr:hypothetical protein [Cyclobacteriaceae bacterium]